MISNRGKGGLALRLLAAGLAVLVLTLLLAVRASAGCCLIVTLEDLPQEIVAGEPVRLTYTVRFNGKLWSVWEGTTTAVHPESGETIEAAIVPADEPGHYTAELIFPTAGTWQWALGGWDMPPLTVLPETAAVNVAQPAPATVAPLPAGQGGLLAAAVGGLVTAVALILWLRRRTPLRLAFLLLAGLVALGGLAWRAAPVAVLAERAALNSSAQVVSAVPPERLGEAIFATKGCITCHYHADLSFYTHRVGIGPELTHYQGNPDFLRQWLSDPQAIRPNTVMPNLELDERELELLVDFLSANEK